MGFYYTPKGLKKLKQLLTLTTIFELQLSLGLSIVVLQLVHVVPVPVLEGTTLAIDARACVHFLWSFEFQREGKRGGSKRGCDLNFENGSEREYGLKLGMAISPFPMDIRPAPPIWRRGLSKKIPQ